MIEEKDILAYLDGNSSLELKRRVEAWIAESTNNQEEFEFTKMMWEESSAAASYVQFDVEDEWSAFEKMVATPKLNIVKKEIGETKVIPINKARSWRTGLSVAASIAVLITATWFLWPQPEYIDIVDASEDMELELDDGSIVSIKQGSSFKTKRVYKYESQRTVDVKGEVKFDIASDPDKPFIVNTEKSAVEVLGTIFNVKAEGIESEVANEEGLVKFFVIEEPEIFVNLEKGDVIKYDGEGFIDLNAPEPLPPPRVIPKVQDILEYLEEVPTGQVKFGSSINENILADFHYQVLSE